MTAGLDCPHCGTSSTALRAVSDAVLAITAELSVERALRKIVKAAAPRAAERGYKGWNVLVFAPTKEMKMKEMFCGISPHKDTVSLYFMKGARLPDPHKVLEGAGKGMRHVKIRSDKDLKPAAIKPLVRAAYLHVTR